MVKIWKFLKNIYLNTYHLKDFRNTMDSTRLLVVYMDTLAIAFFTNLYISGYFDENIFIYIIFLATIASYYISFKLAFESYKHYHEKVNINIKYVLYYLLIEALIVSYIFLKIYYYVKARVL